MDENRSGPIEESTERSAQELVQIGDLARRLGMQVDTLRAWERRYGLLTPQRSSGGFRLYSRSDEAIVRAMLAEIASGYPPAQAAKLALARNGSAGRAADLPGLENVPAELYHALMAFGGARAHGLLDALFAQYSLNAVLREVLQPCLRRIGDDWASGVVSIAQEHFATQLIRERLLGLARDWDQGRGPRALLACPADERHDIGLICFGLVLSRNGWRVTFLGPDTPVSALQEAIEAVTPELVVLSANDEHRFTSIAVSLRALAAGRELALAGVGATAEVARAVGATLLEDSPVAAALMVAARPMGPGRRV